MGVQKRWDKYPLTYRTKEMEDIAGWITAGESGAVVGLPGTGRATLLNVLCRRPDILQTHLEGQNQHAVLIPVDLNNLPNNDLATLYRVILRSIYENREQFEQSLQLTVTNLYEKYQAAQDPFLPQSGLRELLLMFEAEEKKVVLVMNRFDYFCKNATSQMTGTLRGLRDSFKETLCYIMGMKQEVTYLADLPSVGPLYSILDTHVLWVGPLSEADGHDMIGRELETKTKAQSLQKLYSLTGGYPSLIRVVCHWWAKTNAKKELESDTWKSWLVKQKNVAHRLNALLNALTSDEETFLREHGRSKKGRQKKKSIRSLTEQEVDILDNLILKGVCQKSGDNWSIEGELVIAYLNHSAGISRGRIWQDDETGEIFQGKQVIPELAPLERKVLLLFIKKPRYLYTYTELAEGAWIEEDEAVIVEGVSTEAIQRVISNLRKKVEPSNAKPRYIISWRDKPEGGYQFFPEGRPN